MSRSSASDSRALSGTSKGGNVTRSPISATRTGQGQGTDRARVAVRPWMKASIDDQAATDEGADEQIEEIAQRSALSHHQFRGTGRRRVFGKLHRQRRHGLNAISDADFLPAFHHPRRRAEKFTPTAKPKRSGDAHSDEAL